MREGRRRSNDRVGAGAIAQRSAVPGKRTLTSALPRAQRSSAQPAPAHAPSIHDIATATVDAKGSGAAVPEQVRTAAEAQLGADLSGVRVHSDENAQGGAAGIAARAFTHGSDIFLGPGQRADDLHLMTHELTHVVQQGAAHQATPQRKVEVGATDDPAEHQADAVADAAVSGAAQRTGGLVIEDGATPQAGQITKSAFLARIQQAIEAALSALPPDTATELRPQVASQLDQQRAKPATEVEQSIGQATGVGRASSVDGYVAAAQSMVRAQAASGASAAPGGAGAATAGPAPGPASAPAATAAAGAQRKPADSPAAIQHSLGEGRALDGAVAGAASEAYGQSFADVRIHTDGNAARMAADHDARAFTVGNHIAFGAGEYRPDSPEGDALVAHELAHVAQQSTASPTAQRATDQSAAHEHEADGAAAGVLARLYGGAKRAAQRIALTASEGFALQRCPRGAPTLQQQAQALTNDLQQLIHDGTWEAIRARMYPQLAQPIRQRANDRRAGTQPDMTGIASVVSVDAFVQAVHAVQLQWGGLNADDRAQHLLAACNHALAGPGVPPMDYAVQPMVPRGSFSAGGWRFNFREQTMNLPALSNDEAAQVADVTLHESRHCEQHFRVARLLAGQGQSAAQIEASQGIPPAIAQAAFGAPLNAGNSTAQERAEAQQWQQAFGPQGQHNQDISDQVLVEIQALAARNQEAQNALAALQGGVTAQTVQDAIAARDALRHQVTAVEQAYQAYRAIPYEADAHETGITSETAFRRQYP